MNQGNESEAKAENSASCNTVAGDRSAMHIVLNSAEQRRTSQEMTNPSNESIWSASSTSSSASAQVVIDHGHRRNDLTVPHFTAVGTCHLFRSGDEESESDHPYSAHHSGYTIDKKPVHVTHFKPNDKIDTDHAESNFHDLGLIASCEPGTTSPMIDTLKLDNDDSAVADDESECPVDHRTNATLQTQQKAKNRRIQSKHNEPESSTSKTTDRSSYKLNKMVKRTQRVMEADLQSHSWSRRESMDDTDPQVLNGLTSDEALQKLLVIGNQILDEERLKIANNVAMATEIRSWLFRPDTLLSFTLSLAGFVFFVAGYFESDPYQYRLTGVLVESLLIFLMTVWNGLVYRREQQLTHYEMADRASTIISALECNGMNLFQVMKVPFIPSMTVSKVVRDGVVCVIPTNLLVQGDILEMVYGDKAPGRLKYIYQPMFDDSASTVREYYLAKDQILKPSFFGIPPPNGMIGEYMQTRGHHHFMLLDNPLEANLRSALTQTRPKTVISNELQKIHGILYNVVVWVILAISCAINLLRFGLEDFRQHDIQLDQLAEEVFWLPFLAVLPLLPLCIPSLWLIARTFGSAQLLILFEALQISKTDYEDDEEVDEFDTEAPPPTKDLELSPNAVWDRFCSLISKWDRYSLTRSTNLLESLGSTTVICSLDREGTIANPFPTVEQLMFPNANGDITYLDIEEDSGVPDGYTFEDKDWETYLPQLKPVGLNFMLNTSCGVLQGKKRLDYHRSRSRIQVYGRTSPARQTCLCRLAKSIGFQEAALQSFALRAEIYTFAPYHNVLAAPRYQFSQYYTYEVPSTLSTVYEEQNSGNYQLLVDGHPVLVLDKCTDYWDGKMLQTITRKMEKKILDFYQNAEIHDMQCIAYAYRPINTGNQSHIPCLSPFDDKHCDPGCAFVVLPYKQTSDSSSNSSTSRSSNTNHDDDSETSQPHLKRFDSSRLSTSSRNDEQCNAANVPDTGGIGESDHSFEYNGQEEEQSEEAFYKEVVNGQIFLGMAAMGHQPKQNVVDFIEDLGLAGIRFVYFSPTAERESKAFAERLGLETDWNSCILLSNPDDEDCGNGYIQTHDIKAQLPRGIDQIRPHIQNVDDIPLHVSLFAECTSKANKEMIRVFQENGEVVCCIGSALNAQNMESFALADISIAMEPMHTRVQNRGRLSLNGRQPPLAVGASLVSLPCALFMQYETSLYAVTQLIRDARRLLSCIRMSYMFYLGACLSMTILQLLSNCILLPPVLTGYQILWVLWVILPILSLSMLFSPHDDSIMLLMPGKNIDHLIDIKRFCLYFAFRFFPLIIICIVMFSLTLIYSLDLSIQQVVGFFGSNSGWLHWSRNNQLGILYAQNFMLVSFVWCLACISATFLYRTNVIWSSSPLKNKVWIGAFFTVIILQLIFCIVSLATIKESPISFHQIPWFVYFLGCVLPIFVIPIQELVKLHDDKEFTRFQKRSKLEFSTKLGMHSPL